MVILCCLDFEGFFDGVYSILNFYLLNFFVKLSEFLVI